MVLQGKYFFSFQKVCLESLMKYVSCFFIENDYSHLKNVSYYRFSDKKIHV